jgi:hypothetical protein
MLALEKLARELRAQLILDGRRHILRITAGWFE